MWVWVQLELSVELGFGLCCVSFFFSSESRIFPPRKYYLPGPGPPLNSRAELEKPCSRSFFDSWATPHPRSRAVAFHLWWWQVERSLRLRPLYFAAIVRAAARAAIKVGLWDDEVLVPIRWPVARKVSAAPENKEVEL